jgi:SNF2 family DNA or RNA helicase
LLTLPQNKVEELYSLFKFLNIRPLNNWDTFKRQIAGPIKSGQTKVAMKRLHVVLNSVMLRRTKDATISMSSFKFMPRCRD